jgi:hypothetical protein
MKVFCAAVVVLAASAASAHAQIPVGTYVGATAPGGYDSAGRRDPFVSLITPRRPAPSTLPTGTRSTTTGLRSIALADVAVTGVVRKGNVMLAILHGAGQPQSYVARVNDRIMDAVVKSIDAQGVVFVEVVAPGTGARPQELRKALRGAAEGYR